MSSASFTLTFSCKVYNLIFTIPPFHRLESSIIHKFQRPGVFTVGVECTTSDWHVTAQRAITIQEPVGAFSAIKCYSKDVATDGAECNALSSLPVQIQLEVEAGESFFGGSTVFLTSANWFYLLFFFWPIGVNVSYTIQHKDRVIANTSVEKGVTPQNVTLNESALQQLGHGCHNLSIAASNRVTTSSVSSVLVLCLLEPVEGLLASVIAEAGACPDSTDLIIGVTLEQGAPVELLFNLTGARDTLTESRHMLSNSLQTYTFSNPLEGA